MSVRYVLNGLNTDIPASELPPDTWTGVANALNRDGFMRRTRAYTVIQSITNGPRWGLQVGQGAATSLVVLGADVVTVNGTTQGVRTPASGYTAPTSLAQCSGGVINNRAVICTQAVGGGWYWQAISGAGLFLPLPGWTAQFATDACQVMRCWKQHIFAANFPAGSDALAWSSAATTTGGIPTEWVPSSTNDARLIYLGDTAGGIVDLIPLRDSLIVFKRQSMYTLQFIGGAFVFSSRKVTESFGVMAKN